MLKRTTLQFVHRRYQQLCKLSTTESTNKPDDSFRTLENSPLKHTTEHLSKYYRISNETKKQLFLYGGLPKTFQIHIKTFTENCLMIRQPSIDIINALKSIDYTKSTIRFVLYGQQGSGKTLSLAHVLHYGHEAGFLIVHVPWVGSWMRRPKEFSNSPTKEGFVDLQLDAGAWLIHFKTQNQHLLNNPELRTSQDYHWSKREVTQKDAPLLELIEHGISRVKYASSCIVVLAEEIKRLSSEGKCKTLVAIDGFNAFFYSNIRVHTEKKEPIHPHKITLTEAFLNLTKFDWNNGVCVLTVDELAIATEDQTSHLPMYLLGKDGFEHIDPFIPIEVPGYSDTELISCLNYFRERKWIQVASEYDKELSTLSASNPYKLMQLCAPL